MEPQPVDVLDERSEIVVPLDGQPARVAPGSAGKQLDDWLVERGHRTYVVVLEADVGKDPKDRKKLPKVLAELPEGEGRIRAELHVPGQAPRTAWFLPGCDRKLGREVAKKLKTSAFLWARTAWPLEVHDVKGLEDDFYELDDGRWGQLVKEGNHDLGHSMIDLAEEPRTLVDVLGGKVAHVVLYVVTLLAIAFGAYQLLKPTEAEPQVDRTAQVDEPAPEAEDGDDGDEEDDDDGFGPGSVVKRILHPALLPALLVGWCLRRRRDRHRALEERTADESELAWRNFAPELAAAWLLAIAGVVVITLARAYARGGPTMDLAEDLGQAIVISLWLLPAVTYSADFGDLVGRVIGDFFGAVFAIFALKLFLKIAGWINDLIWSVVKGVLPEAPDWLKFTLELVTTLSAEGLMLYLMFGYVWSLQRQRFLRWGSGEGDDD